jgi:hypothetical protein
MAEDNQDESPNVIETEDPKLAANATPEQITEYVAEVNKFSRAMLAAFEVCPEAYGQNMWLDFITTFSVEGIEALETTQVLAWRTLLLKRGVHVRVDRFYSRKKALIEVIQSDEFPHPGASESPLGDVGDSPGDDRSHAPMDTSSNPVATRNGTGDNGLAQTAHGANPSPSCRNMNMLGDVADSSRREQAQNSRGDEYSGGLGALSKFYQGRARYSGGLDEDLVGAVQIYRTISAMCNLTHKEMATGVPVMLDGDALSFFSAHLAGMQNFEAILQRLSDEYTSEEQRNRLLRIWQKTSLAASMRASPEKSELSVFKDVCRLLTKTQRQLHADYHKDRFLRDQIVIAADIPHVERSLREKATASSQEAIQRIAALLSSEPASAGSYIVQEDENQALYGLGRRFGGDARRKTYRKNFGASAKSPRNVKGCWVCGKDHKARDHHTREQVIAALQKHRENGALISADCALDCMMIGAQMSDHDKEDSHTGTDSEAHLAAEVLETNKYMESEMRDVAFLHAITSPETGSGLTAVEKKRKSSMAREFRGLIIDTGANRSSLMSLAQYLAYCREFGAMASIDKSQVRKIRGVGGVQSTIGAAKVPVPFPGLGLVLEIEFQVLKADVPTLLSLRDLKRHELDLRVLSNTIEFGGRSQSLLLEKGFLVHRWDREDATHVLYTEEDLRKLHRAFGHPAVSTLANLLRRARPEEMNAAAQNVLQEIAKSCKICSTNAARPKHFKLTVGTEDIAFNHVVTVDVMYLAKRPVLHCVDEGTHYMAAKFMKSVTASETWKTLISCWIRTYLGPPDNIRVDQGSNFTSEEFRAAAKAYDIEVLEAPVESPATMSHVERYHAPLRAAYEKVSADLHGSITDEEALEIAVKCVNDVIGPEGLCPTLLVYGSLPSPARTKPAASQLQRARAMDEARTEVSKEHARRRVQFGLHYKGPFGNERQDLDALQFGAEVSVYRAASGRWEGPFRFVSKEGETVVVELANGRKIFRSNAVRPWRVTADTCRATDIRGVAENDTNDVAADGEKECPHALAADKGTEFDDSRRSEIDGLMQRGVFRIVPRSEVVPETRIYRTKWVDSYKTVNGQRVQKSRLVAQNFNDKGAADIPTRSPTVSRVAQRFIIAAAAIFPTNVVYIRDISQAYVQSHSYLERPVYLEAPPEMEVAENHVLVAQKPLYGIPESGLHWFLTYHGHHCKLLGMQESTADMCLLYRHDPDGGTNMTVLQVDDSLGHGTKDFLNEEERASKEFIGKPRKILAAGASVTFNGCDIRKDTDGGFLITQGDKLRSLAAPSNEDQAVRTRASIQYIAACSRPDLSSCSQLLSTKVINPDTQTIKELTKIVSWCHESADLGLRFVQLDKDSVRIALFADASFANSDSYGSQIAFVVCLVDEQNRANIVHYGSQKCRRVVRSVMAAELHALVYGFDHAFMVKTISEEILGRVVHIDAYIDSRTVFNTVARLGSTLEKRLQIDIHALRQSHHRGELRSLSWIPSHQNVADALTKTLPGKEHALYKLMQSNRLDVNPEGWVQYGNRKYIANSDTREAEVE